MEERQITVDGKTYALPSPFIVMATQNPIETEGTFPLPAAQMDRFMVKISMGYPSQDEESRMLVQLGDEMPFHKVNSVLDSKVVVELQHEIQEVYISEDVTKYIVDVVQSTRQHNMVRVGASPRASRVLYKAGKVWAAMKQRDYVTPDDIQEIVMSILSHRLMLTNEARLSRKTREEILSDIMSSVPVPPNRKGILYGR
jgi:MoxR-like ATPase